MEQHPIPQDITGFKFKLVGDMTLVQFGYLATGLVMGWVFYSTPWYPFVKYPLAIISASAGAAFAFLPIEDRPLAVWVKNFFKSIYQPTFLVWEKTASVPLDSPLLSSPFGNFGMPTIPSLWAFPKRNATQPEKPKETQTPPSEKQTEQDTPIVHPPTVAPPPITPPVSNTPVAAAEIIHTVAPTPVDQNNLVIPQVVPTTQTTTTLPNQSLSVDELITLREEKLKELQREKEQLYEAGNQARLDQLQGSAGSPQIIDIAQLERLREKDITVPKQDEQLQELLRLNADLIRQIEQVKSSAQQLTLGDQRTSLENQMKDLALSREKLALKIAALQQELANPTAPKPAPISLGQNISIVPRFDRQAPTVSLSDLPNVVSGLVKDGMGNPVVGAIVLINDKSGNPVRALKTNKIGQFITNTPLDNGAYYIEIEKEGYNFDTMAAQLTGQVLPLLEIRGQLVSGGQSGPV